MIICIYPFWDNIVSCYYDNDIQHRSPELDIISIWEWLELDYGAKRIFNHNINSIVDDNLRFKSKEDLVIFKLRFS